MPPATSRSSTPCASYRPHVRLCRIPKVTPATEHSRKPQAEGTVMKRLAAYGLVLALTAIAAAPQVRAEDYPSRPIRLIIGFPPGSAADITARLVGDHMSKTLGQQIVVEAPPGAGSSLAA